MMIGQQEKLEAETEAIKEDTWSKLGKIYYSQ